MRKKISLLLLLLLTFSSFFINFNSSYATEAPPQITAHSAVLMDYESGEILYEKNAHEKIYPASTTKMWTAYLTLKHVKDLNEIIHIDSIPPVEGSSMYLKEGESFTVRQLLESLMVHSSNDVAVVLANYISGSVEEFVKLMNKEAINIGAKSTHFNNPHGLPDEEHYTTAYDMALMSRVAMNNSIFREIINLKSIKYPPTESYPYERYFKNTNKFLTGGLQIPYKGQLIDSKYDIMDGIKTGYTDDAGRCLLSSAQKNDMRLISVVFKTDLPNLYGDSRTLIDYGFDNFESKTIVNKVDYINNENILLSKQKKLTYAPESNYNVIAKKLENNKKYTTKAKLGELKLPIKKGDIVGQLEVYENSKLVTEIPLIAQNDVTSVFSALINSKIFKIIVNTIIVLIGSMIVFIIGVLIRKKIRRKRKSMFYTNKKRNRYKRNRF